MAGDNSLGSDTTPKHVLYSRALGKRPVLSVKMGGVDVNCLLDTGSQVTTVTESFFQEHLQSVCKQIVSPGSWITLTAANGLQIPYSGYVELDMEIAGRTIPKRGILIVKDPVASSGLAVQKQTVPGLLGMNVIGQCVDLLMGDLNVLSPEELHPQTDVLTSAPDTTSVYSVIIMLCFFFA